MSDRALHPVSAGVAWRRGSKFDFIRAIKREVYADRARVLSAPVEASWQVTLACNLSCDYCYAECGPGESGGRAERVRRLAIAEELGRAGLLDVTIEGGEPFLCDDLPDILAVLKSHRVAVDILTNGTLVSAARVEALGAILDRRVDTFQVSVDSIDPAVNDRHRGAGALTAARRGIALLLDAGFNVRVNAVATADSVEGLPALYRALVDLGVNGGFAVAPLFPTGRGRGLVRPDRTVAEAVMARLRALERVTPRLGVSGCLVPAATEAVCPGDPLGARLGACSGGRAKIAVAPDGVVTPCVFYDRARFALGALPDQTLAAIWSGEAAIRHRGWVRDGACVGCDRASDCAGVCVGMTLDQCPSTRRLLAPFSESRR